MSRYKIGRTFWIFPEQNWCYCGLSSCSIMWPSKLPGSLLYRLSPRSGHFQPGAQSTWLFFGAPGRAHSLGDGIPLLAPAGGTVRDGVERCAPPLRSSTRPCVAGRAPSASREGVGRSGNWMRGCGGVRDAWSAGNESHPARGNPGCGHGALMPSGRGNPV